MRACAYAKINLGLAVGPLRRDGRHEIVTVLERVDLHDLIDLERSREPGIAVEGFAADTLVRRALELFDGALGADRGWRVRLEKRIPLAAGLGGGSSDAAAALRLANETSGERLAPAELHELASAVGADVPFFLSAGAKLATGAGVDLEPVDLPRGYRVLLVLPHDARKESTGAVYASVHASVTAAFHETRGTLLAALGALNEPRDLARVPPNQLVRPDPTLAKALSGLGAFRVDSSGAGPTTYALFEDEEDALRAARTVRGLARTWVARPVPGP